ncbi:hypothetical protein GMES_3783 [Paraglaciecola mesophila KMM 241]|uniref:Uncharacterized protein n=1 Tax=Paraglaciecola mesophila KMM 241 TaxID=1128912 RepID=K6XZN0_9ALTE|nr:hypothetical protein GMES_3783 [Paraglaciecola mesophila KMM 241]
MGEALALFASEARPSDSGGRVTRATITLDISILIACG